MSDAPSFIPDHDFAELLWQNGPIVMQGQSNRQKRSSNSTPFPSQNLRVQEKDGRDPAMRKFLQFEDTDWTVNKLSPPVPCANMGLNTHDDDMAHWMNYPIEDPLCSEFFFELAGINPNPRPTERTNGFVAKDFHNVENRNTSKALGEDSEPSKSRTIKLFQSSVENTKLAASSIHQGQPQKQDLPLTSKPLHSSSGCGLMNFSHFARPVSLVRTNNESLDRLKANEMMSLTTASTKPKLAASSIHQGQPQKQDLPLTSKPLHSSSGCGLMNFSHFARPVSLVRTNNESVDRLKANEMMSLTTASINPMESILVESSRTLHKVEMRSIVKAKGDIEAICGDVGSRNNPCNTSSVVGNNFTSSNHKVNNQSLSFTASVAGGRNESEKGPEPVVASSSVCSGNSAGAASNDPKHREKRKNLEGEESGYRSEDLDDESMGLKKPTAMRGGTSTKRSRAAEVHNLSERRRRDRINEKMRALQELIPNCNKVDKVSMLDEAIEYLKTLQLQVQMMSMGSGLCMPPMMLPPALQHIRAPQMAHFSPMNVGMGMGMGLSYGMGVLDMNGIPIPSMHTSQFPCTPIPGSSGLQLFGIPGHGQGLPMPFPRPPLFNPLSNLTPTGNSVNEVMGSMSNPLRASDMGPSSRCVNLEAKQNTTNSGAQVQLAQLSNPALHPSGNAAANTYSSTVNGSNG